MSLPVPCTHLLINGKETEVYRCETDGGIVFNTQSSLRLHAGHKLKNPVIIKDSEMRELEAELTEHDLS